MNKRCKAPIVAIDWPLGTGVNLYIDTEHLHDSKRVVGCVLERDIAGNGCNPY